jgi:hypothetical protein
MTVEWRGKQVTAKLRRAEREAIDATMAACIRHAKADHGEGVRKALKRFESISGELERSIRIIRPAKRRGRATVGSWGSQGLVYARRIELGFQGKDARGAVVDAPDYPFLRPAAEVEYPKLAPRIRRAFKRRAA